MYVDNGKISGRQTFRLYVFDLMGISTLLIPPYLAGLSGSDGIFCILIGSLLGYGYLRYLGYVMAKMDTDVGTYLEQNYEKLVQRICFGIVLFHCVWTSGFCAYVFCNLIQYSLVKEVSYVWLLLVVVLVGAYGVSGGIESRARVYEVLFWFILIPYVIMMCLGIRDFELSYMDGFLKTEPMNLVKGVYLVFLFLTPLFFSLFLLSKKENRQYGGSMIKTISKALVTAVVILLGSYIILLGNFGSGSLSTMRFPVITLMSTIQLKGNFLKRMDALMLAVWFFTIFALLNLHIHYGTSMLKKITGKAKDWQVMIISAAIFVSAWMIEEIEGMLDLFLKYYSYIAVPVMVVGPGLLLLKDKKKKAVVTMTVLLLAGTLMGCGATELEERCFPMLVAVDYEDDKKKVTYYESLPGTESENKGTLITSEIQVPIQFGEDFKESKENYERNLNKIPDYNHLKVLVLGESLVENRQLYKDMLANLAASEEFPRNAYVCMTEDIDDLLEIQKNLPQEIGSYLEEFLENHEEKKDRMLTLGDLLDEQQNQDMILYAPYLEPEDTYVEWGGYYALGENQEPVELD